MRPIAIRQANLGRGAGVLGASARASLHDVQTKSAEVSRMMLSFTAAISYGLLQLGQRSSSSSRSIDIVYLAEQTTDQRIANRLSLAQITNA
jgi:hypothetical protein